MKRKRNEGTRRGRGRPWIVWGEGDETQSQVCCPFLSLLSLASSQSPWFSFFFFPSLASSFYLFQMPACLPPSPAPISSLFPLSLLLPTFFPAELMGFLLGKWSH